MLSETREMTGNKQHIQTAEIMFLRHVSRYRLKHRKHTDEIWAKLNHNTEVRKKRLDDTIDHQRVAY